MAHTATPWASRRDPDGFSHQILGGPSGFVTLADFITQEDAAFIVLAVNSHDALVEALTGLLDRYTALVNCGDCGNWNAETEAEVIAARAALALATLVTEPVEG